MVQSSFRIAALAAGALALAGVAAQANGNAPAFDCGIDSKTSNGMLSVAGLVTSPTTIQGEYRFALRSMGGGGSSNINQGGQFSAAANSPASVGQVMVNAGSHIDIDFTITVDGKQFDCSSPLATRT